MSRTFVYARVSTADQHTANQAQEIQAAGFTVDKRRVIEETISGRSQRKSVLASRGYWTDSRKATC